MDSRDVRPGDVFVALKGEAMDGHKFISAAFAKGGTDATVTDADVTLGLIDPELFAEGRLDMDTKAARQALEAFVENPQDATRMRFCQTYVHQVLGTLQMVEFFGAALLAEEMEQVCAYLATLRAGKGREDGLARSSRRTRRIP